jgi:hypothetical protein
MGESQRRLTKQRCMCVALHARYAELLRLREFVKHMEDCTAGGMEIKLDERALPMLSRGHPVPCVTMRRRPKL